MKKYPLYYANWMNKRFAAYDEILSVENNCEPGDLVVCNIENTDYKGETLRHGHNYYVEAVGNDVISLEGVKGKFRKEYFYHLNKTLPPPSNTVEPLEPGTFVIDYFSNIYTISSNGYGMMSFHKEFDFGAFCKSGYKDIRHYKIPFTVIGSPVKKDTKYKIDPMYSFTVNGYTKSINGGKIQYKHPILSFYLSSRIEPGVIYIPHTQKSIKYNYVFHPKIGYKLYITEGLIPIKDKKKIEKGSLVTLIKDDKKCDGTISYGNKYCVQDILKCGGSTLLIIIDDKGEETTTSIKNFKLISWEEN